MATQKELFPDPGFDVDDLLCCISDPGHASSSSSAASSAAYSAAAAFVSESESKSQSESESESESESVQASASIEVIALAATLAPGQKSLAKLFELHASICSKLRELRGLIERNVIELIRSAITGSEKFIGTKTIIMKPITMKHSLSIMTTVLGTLQTFENNTESVVFKPKNNRKNAISKLGIKVSDTLTMVSSLKDIQTMIVTLHEQISTYPRTVPHVSELLTGFDVSLENLDAIDNYERTLRAISLALERHYNLDVNGPGSNDPRKPSLQIEIRECITYNDGQEVITINADTYDYTMFIKPFCKLISKVFTVMDRITNNLVKHFIPQVLDFARGLTVKTPEKMTSNLIDQFQESMVRINQQFLHETYLECLANLPQLGTFCLPRNRVEIIRYINHVLTNSIVIANIMDNIMQENITPSVDALFSLVPKDPYDYDIEENKLQVFNVTIFAQSLVKDLEKFIRIFTTFMQKQLVEQVPGANLSALSM